jgi:hypothetical protein
MGPGMVHDVGGGNERSGEPLTEVLSSSVQIAGGMGGA